MVPSVATEINTLSFALWPRPGPQFEQIGRDIIFQCSTAAQLIAARWHFLI